jgi:hypothetical protein
VLSERFQLEIMRARLRGVRQYQLAMRVGLHPSSFSQMLHGSIPVELGDPRIIKLGATLGLTAADCFAGQRSDRTNESPARVAAR